MLQWGPGRGGAGRGGLDGLDGRYGRYGHYGQKPGTSPMLLLAFPLASAFLCAFAFKFFHSTHLS